MVEPKLLEEEDTTEYEKAAGYNADNFKQDD